MATVKEQQQQAFVRQRKLCIFGYSNTGKTAIVEQYTQGTFSHEHYPTTNKTSSKVCQRNGCDYLVHILDTVGQDECGFFDPQYTIGTDGYMLVYSVVSRESFEMVKRIYNDLWAYTPLVPFVLVATKVDLTHERVVTEQDGRALAAQWGCDYFEVTSRTGKSAANMIAQLLEKIDAMYDDSDTFFKPMPRQQQSCSVM
uniref:GTP-binding protein Rheb isoform 3 n=1 Tax=Rhynchopus euleeides TaxID=630703 RepID=A0A2R4IKW8_9EUGL|nr:GTP-binding protein Rheb isoform 3 [Rhynchopus euleeides]|eukprot:TRINITY_DN59811_c0_g1_i1.p1 TRINITY_DN59811_c0_g1~~TRINITY_DN59811_c0_g1_i1.p1  ORF type:complete len:199 (+),score=73.88 TRINITY_DN59811_c0_g1_i1:94-690(+)